MDLRVRDLCPGKTPCLGTVRGREQGLRSYSRSSSWIRCSMGNIAVESSVVSEVAACRSTTPVRAKTTSHASAVRAPLHLSWGWDFPQKRSAGMQHLPCWGTGLCRHTHPHTFLEARAKPRRTRCKERSQERGSQSNSAMRKCEGHPYRCTTGRPTNLDRQGG